MSGSPWLYGLLVFEWSAFTCHLRSQPSKWRATEMSNLNRPPCGPFIAYDNGVQGGVPLYPFYNPSSTDKVLVWEAEQRDRWWYRGTLRGATLAPGTVWKIAVPDDPPDELFLAMAGAYSAFEENRRA